MSKRGGLRAGAGRPKQDNKLLSLRVPRTLLDQLNARYPDIKERNSQIVAFLEKIIKS